MVLSGTLISDSRAMDKSCEPFVVGLLADNAFTPFGISYQNGLAVFEPVKGDTTVDPRVRACATFAMLGQTNEEIIQHFILTGKSEAQRLLDEAQQVVGAKSVIGLFGASIASNPADMYMVQRAPSGPLADLVKRQRTILDLLVAGESTVEIAQELTLGREAVKNNITRIGMAFGSDRPALLATAAVLMGTTGQFPGRHGSELWRYYQSQRSASVKLGRITLSAVLRAA